MKHTLCSFLFRLNIAFLFISCGGRDAIAADSDAAVRQIEDMAQAILAGITNKTEAIPGFSGRAEVIYRSDGKEESYRAEFWSRGEFYRVDVYRGDECEFKYIRRPEKAIWARFTLPQIPPHLAKPQDAREGREVEITIEQPERLPKMTSYRKFGLDFDFSLAATLNKCGEQLKAMLPERRRPGGEIEEIEVSSPRYKETDTGAVSAEMGLRSFGQMDGKRTLFSDMTLEAEVSPDRDFLPVTTRTRGYRVFDRTERLDFDIRCALTYMATEFGYFPETSTKRVINTYSNDPNGTDFTARTVFSDIRFEAVPERRFELEALDIPPGSSVRDHTLMIAYDYAAGRHEERILERVMESAAISPTATPAFPAGRPSVAPPVAPPLDSDNTPRIPLAANSMEGPKGTAENGNAYFWYALATLCLTGAMAVLYMKLRRK